MSAAGAAQRRQPRRNKARAPWRVVYSESFATRAEAVRRERYRKTGRGRDELRKILA